MKTSALALLLLCACGNKRMEPKYPANVVEALNAEIARIQPLLVRCDGAPGKLPCDSLDRQSDNFGLIAYERLSFADSFADSFVLNSVDDSGKPYRSPAHRAANIDSFSRDHAISLAQWSLASGNVEHLKRVIAYAAKNNWYVCGQARCLLTPGLLNVLGDVASRFGDKRPFGTNVPDSVAEAQITIDAKSGQNCVLVLDTIVLKVSTGNLTKAFANAAKECNDTHQTLYSRYVYQLTHGGDYASLQEDILAELQAWQQADGPHFTRNSSGYALIYLAKAVQARTFAPVNFKE